MRSRTTSRTRGRRRLQGRAHGSLNATPKTLWNNFKKKSKKKSAANRLTTVMSTVTDSKHGDPEHDSEVPREKLVTALRGFSTLRTTQELEADGDLVIEDHVRPHESLTASPPSAINSCAD